MNWSAVKNSRRAITQRTSGRNSQELDRFESILGSQNQQKNEEHGFGVQFVNKAYTVNLSPADIQKHGPAYDLAIAVGVLAATDQVPLGALENALFVGELSLDGSVRHVRGVMPVAYTAKLEGYRVVYVPVEDAPEAALVSGIEVIPVATLGQLIEHLYGMNVIPPYLANQDDANHATPDGFTDFADIRG